MDAWEESRLKAEQAFEGTSTPAPEATPAPPPPAAEVQIPTPTPAPVAAPAPVESAPEQPPAPAPSPEVQPARPMAIPGVPVAQRPEPGQVDPWEAARAKGEATLAGQKSGTEMSFLDEIGQSAIRGVGAFARMPKQVLSVFGGSTDVTEKMAKAGEELEEAHPASPSVSGSLTETPSLALNPQWWAATAPGLLVQIAPMIVAGLLAPEAGAGAAIAKAVQYGGGAVMGVTDAAQRMLDYERANPTKEEIPVLKRIMIGMGAGVAGMVLPGRTMKTIMGPAERNAAGEIVSKGFVPLEQALTKVFAGPTGKKIAENAVSVTMSSGSMAGFSVIENAFEKYGYNPERDITQGVLESLVLGAALGGMEHQIGKYKISRQELADKLKKEVAAYEEYKKTGKSEEVMGTQFKETDPYARARQADELAAAGLEMQSPFGPKVEEAGKTPEPVAVTPKVETPPEDLSLSIFGPSVNGGSVLGDIMLSGREPNDILRQLHATVGSPELAARFYDLYNKGDYATALKEFPSFASKEQRTFGRSDEGGNHLGDIVQAGRNEADTVRQLKVELGDDAKAERFYELWKSGAVDIAYKEFHKEITTTKEKREVPAQAVGPEGEPPAGPVPMATPGDLSVGEHDIVTQGERKVTETAPDTIVMTPGEYAADAARPETGLGKQDADTAVMLETIRKIGEGAATKADIQDVIAGKQGEGMSRLEYLKLRQTARQEVERRLQDGESVEPDVLRRFPDLADKYGETPPVIGNEPTKPIPEALRAINDRISEVDEHIQALKDLGRTGTPEAIALNAERVDLVQQIRDRIANGEAPISGFGNPLVEVKAPASPIGGAKNPPVTPPEITEVESGMFKVAGVDGEFNSRGEAKRVQEIVHQQMSMADPEVMFSVNTLADWAKKAMRIGEKRGMDVNDILSNIEQLKKIGQVLLGRPEFLPPEDLTKSPVRGNADYIKTMDFDTNCPKRDLYAAIIDEVENRMQRLMTSDELFGLALKLQAEGLEAPCIYCYVEGGRRAFNEGVYKYMETRNNLIDIDRFRQWWKAKNEPGAERFPVTAEEAAEFERVRAYAQASSMANLPKPYAPYKGQLLNASFQKTLEIINQRAGMRYQSNNDFRIQFVLDYMQSVVDLAMLKSKAHAYTKQPDFARIFGGTGMRIAQSLFCKDGPNGTFVEDVQNGMPWKAAKENMEKFPDNVGTIMVTTNDAQTLWAMGQDWIEQVIPFHRSGITKEQFSSLKFEDYTVAQTEKWKDPKANKGKKPPHFDWDAHHNDLPTYLKLCEEAGVYPRFREWVNEPGYMKVITDFVKLDVPQQPVRPVFDYEYTEQAIKKWQAEGGPNPPTVDQAFVNEFINKMNANDAMFRIENALDAEGLKGVQTPGREYERSPDDQAGVPRWKELPLLSTPNEGGRFFDALREWAVGSKRPGAEAVWKNVRYSEALTDHPYIAELHQQMVDMGFHDIRILPMEGMPIDAILGGVMTHTDGRQFFILNDKLPEAKMRQIADHEIFHKRSINKDPLAAALKKMVDPLSPVTVKIGRMLNKNREQLGYRSLTADGVAEEICADLVAGVNRFFTMDEVLDPFHAMKSIDKARQLVERYHAEAPTATPEQMRLMEMYKTQPATEPLAEWGDVPIPDLGRGQPEQPHKISPEEEKGMARTASKGGMLAKPAQVTKYLMGLEIDPGTPILDFGAGPKIFQTQHLRDAGFTNVKAVDLPTNMTEGVHNPEVFTNNEQFPVVFASRVLNVQPSDTALHETLKALRDRVAQDGMAIANYPDDPRYPKNAPKSADEMKAVLEQYFGSVERVGGTKKAPIFELSEPIAEADRTARLKVEDKTYATHEEAMDAALETLEKRWGPFKGKTAEYKAWEKEWRALAEGEYATKEEAFDAAMEVLERRWAPPGPPSKEMKAYQEWKKKWGKEEGLPPTAGDAFDAAMEILEKRWPVGMKDFDFRWKMAGDGLTGQVVGSVADAKKSYDGLRREITKLFNTARLSKDGTVAHQIIAGNAAKTDLEVKRMTRKLQQYAKEIGNIDSADSQAFCKLYQSGNIDRINNPLFRAFADTFRAIEREQYETMKGLNIEPKELDWYFDQLWVKDDKYKEVMNNVLRSMSGPTYFLNERTIPSIPEGIAMGLTPKYTNLVDMAIAGRAAHQRYIGAQSNLIELDARGWAKTVKGGAGEAPEGWVKFPGAWGDVYARVERKGGFMVPEAAQENALPLGGGPERMGYEEVPGFSGYMKVGERYGPADVVAQFENLVTRGLEGNALYNIWQGSIDTIRQFQMFGSAFHVCAETINSVANAAGMGLTDAMGGLFTGDPVRAAKGMKNLLASPASMIQDVRGGLRLNKALLNPEWAKTHDPLALEIGNLLTNGGMRTQQEQRLSRILKEHFENAWKEYGQLHLGKGTQELFRGFSAAIMDYVVPFSKNGAAMRQYLHEVAKWEKENPGKTMDNETQRNIAYEVREHSDDTFGKIAMDNVAMRSGIRSLLAAVIQYPTWNIGTVKLFARAGIGGKDILMKAADFMTGKEVRQLDMKDRLAVEHVAGLLFVVGMMGMITNIAMTGEQPKNLEDFFFPRTGAVKANGAEERIQFPTYLKDSMGITHHPFETIGAKMSAPIHIVTDLIRNKDYWGSQIYDPNDWTGQKMWDVAGHVVKSSAPFSLSGYQQTEQKSPGMAVLNALGARPVSRQYTNTPAQARMDEILQLKKGTSSKAEADKFKIKSDLYHMARTGDVQGFNETLQEHVSNGVISREEAKQMVKNVGEHPMVIHLKNLSLEQALGVWELTNEKEKDVLAEAMVKKISNASSEKRASLADQLYPALKELRLVRKLRGEADAALIKLEQARREEKINAMRVGGAKIPLYQPKRAVE